jgi:hypothetical protein
MNDSEIEKYIEFTEETITYIKSTISLFHNTTEEITPDQINGILASYYGIVTWLTERYEVETIHYKRYLQGYKTWWAEKNREASRKINADRTKSKFASSGEIEGEAIADNKDEYNKRNDDIIIMERRVSLYKHLLDSWKDVLYIATTLSSNSRADMKSLGIERIYNKQRTIKKPRREEIE